ncbi:unnamed protein product [Amaranthus hypochondriacus]
MASSCFQNLRRAARLSFSLCKSSQLNFLFSRLTLHNPSLIGRTLGPPKLPEFVLVSQKFSYGTVNLVILQGKPKFEVQESDPPKKEKWQTKKRLKMQRMREKQKRKAANRRDPRRLTAKRKKQKFASVEERIKDKLEKARIKEALLVERLKKYEVPKVQGPVVEPHKLTGEEKFYFRKMAQKRSNYVPVGRRGIFGGVVLNMHMHWKKHETVKVFFKPCKPGQVHEYVKEIERLSGGIAIQIIGDDTAIFYRGKNYVQPEVMSPIDTLSKKKALEKSKYEQSLETVRHFIAVAEKELELYYRHIALYGDSNKEPCNAISQNLEEEANHTANVNASKSENHTSTLSDPEVNGVGNASSSEPEQDDDCLSQDEDDMDSEVARGRILKW